MYMHLALVAIFVEIVLFFLGRSLKIPRGSGLSGKEALEGSKLTTLQYQGCEYFLADIFDFYTFGILHSNFS